MAKKSIQIRNVPEELHAELTARAKAAGTTIGPYLLGELEKLVAPPPPPVYDLTPPPRRRLQRMPPKVPVQRKPEDAADVIARMKSSGLDRARRVD